MRYNEAVEYLSNLTIFGIKLGLERFSEFMRMIENPHDKFNSIHIAGTNGKGSTCAFIASILQETRYSVGGYFSPYVFDLRERITLNGKPISKQLFLKHINKLKPIADVIAQTEHGHITEFEMKTAVAFDVFASAQVDFACVEVGMGGRLDATNVISPHVCIITNIGLDHTDRLGKTHAEIAYEKAGIIKPNTPVITAAENPSAFEVIKKIAQERSAPLFRVRHADDDASCAATWRRLSIDRVEVICFGRRYLLKPKHLFGAYQAPNIACAVACANVLREAVGIKIDDTAVLKGIRKASLPGRFQTLRRNPAVIIDAAHNAEAAEALAQTIVNYYPSRQIWLILGMTNNHDPAGFIKPLAPLAKRIIATQPTINRALSKATLVEACNKEGYAPEVFDNVNEALNHALEEVKSEDVIVVTGSFYTIGDIDVKRLLKT